MAFIAAKGAPSVAISVVRGNDTLVMKAWGMADLELSVPATARSVYKIGSVTKQFTSSMVMQLVEQGKVKLDDSIATYLPALPLAWHTVTVRQLLNHTSGIPSYTDIGQRWVRRWGDEMSPDSLVALTANDSMWFAPGTKWRYDNSGYIVLGMLVEKLTGKSWGANVIERFAKPLGLPDTRECLTDPIIPRRVAGYYADSGTWHNAPYLAMSQPYAAGSLCSTIGDLAKWNRALNTGHVVSAGSYTTMTTPAGAAAAVHYGFGIGVDSIAGHAVITHNGGIHGFSSANMWVPSAQLSVTVLSNGNDALVGTLAKQIVRAALGLPFEQPPKAVALTAADRAKYLGIYALVLPDGPHDFTIAAQGEGLTAQLVGQGANPIRYLGNDTFGVDFDPKLRITFSVENGRATKLTLLQNGATFLGSRK
ncbi:MAG: serine hydrolase domain-containing protein, partial [Gemmatimonadales bacterium]